MDNHERITSVNVGDYVFDSKELLGTGATAKVYIGYNRLTYQKYAIKEIKSERYLDLEYQREIEILRPLKHRNIVNFYGAQTNDNHKYIILDYCSGNSVRETLSKAENYYGFEPKLFFVFQNDMTEGLKYLNDQGIVHRDLKPENILEHFDNYHQVIFKISDFGVAEHKFRRVLGMVGTDGYLAPEVFKKYSNIDATIEDLPKTDLWSFGVTLYQIASGRRPFQPVSGFSDRRTMDDMINNKPANAISADQNAETMMVTWSDKLPGTCRINSAKKEVLENIFAHLLKTDFRERYSFDDYYQVTQKLLKLSVSIDIFQGDTGEILTILYDIDKPISAATFKESIAKATEIHAVSQLLTVNHCIADDFWKTPSDVRSQLRNIKSLSICLYNKLLDAATPFFKYCSIPQEFDTLLINLDPSNDKKDLIKFKQNVGVAILKMEDMDRNHQKQRLLKESFVGLAAMVKEKTNDLQILTNVNSGKTATLKKGIDDLSRTIVAVSTSVEDAFRMLETKSQNENLRTYYKDTLVKLFELRKKLECLHQEYTKINDNESGIIDYVENIKTNDPDFAPLALVHDIDNQCSACNRDIVESIKKTYAIISKNNRLRSRANRCDAHGTDNQFKSKSDIKDFIDFLSTLSIKETDCRKSLLNSLADHYSATAKNLGFLNQLTKFIEKQTENERRLSAVQEKTRIWNDELRAITASMAKDITKVSSIKKIKKHE